ncbi:MAG: DsbA family protein [Pseudomonadota bacterium]
MKEIEVYWSHQSPYCYFALDRLLALKKHPQVSLSLRPVLPGVIRDGGLFAERSVVEQDYFLRDVARTAAFLGLPYGEARPYPVEFQPGTLYRAAPGQPRVFWLYYLTAAALEVGKGWDFLDQISRLIWDGTTTNWHKTDVLRAAVAQAGLDYDDLAERASRSEAAYDRLFAQNRDAMLQAGHWGVPLFVFEGEPFYGQDRFDQLLWRLGVPEKRLGDDGEKDRQKSQA